MSLRNPGQRARVWREVIRRQKISGLSIAQFCRQEGLAQPSFYNWRKKLAAESPGPSQNPSPFLELQLPRLTNSTPCEIVLPRCRVVVPPGFDPDCLRQLLDVLGQEDVSC